jgi:hypothetical protein
LVSTCDFYSIVQVRTTWILEFSRGEFASEILAQGFECRRSDRVNSVANPDCSDSSSYHVNQFVRFRKTIQVVPMPGSTDSVTDLNCQNFPLKCSSGSENFRIRGGLSGFGGLLYLHRNNIDNSVLLSNLKFSVCRHFVVYTAQF